MGGLFRRLLRCEPGRGSQRRRARRHVVEIATPADAAANASQDRCGDVERGVLDAAEFGEGDHLAGKARERRERTETAYTQHRDRRRRRIRQQAEKERAGDVDDQRPHGEAVVAVPPPARLSSGERASNGCGNERRGGDHGRSSNRSASARRRRSAAAPTTTAATVVASDATAYSAAVPWSP